MRRITLLILSVFALSCESATVAGYSGDMALPNSRDFDAVDAGPLPHGTVNALQDAAVALTNNVHGEQKLWIGAAALQGHAVNTATNVPEYATSAYNGWTLPDGVALGLQYDFSGLPVGAVVREMEFFGRAAFGTGPAYDTFKVSMNRAELRAFTSSIETPATPASDTDPSDLYLKFDAATAGWPFTISETHRYSLEITRENTPDDSNVIILGALLLVDYSAVLVHQ